MIALILVLVASVAHAAIDNFHQVSPGIYRGARPDAEGFQRLSRLGVKTVVNLQGGDGEAFGELVYLKQPGEDPRVIAWERALSSSLGMQFIHAPMSSLQAVGSRTARSIDMATRVLADSSLRPVFIHCEYGRDRTGLIVALHRVRQEGWMKSSAMSEWASRGHSGMAGWLTRGLDDYFERAAQLR